MCPTDLRGHLDFLRRNALAAAAEPTSEGLRWTTLLGAWLTRPDGFYRRCMSAMAFQRISGDRDRDTGSAEGPHPNIFDQLPLLLAVPRAAVILGISRAAAYRLAASGDLPVRRLGGRIYVVTAELRGLLAS